MNTPNLLASKLLTISVSISIVLCSLSLLIFSISNINTINAESIDLSEKSLKKAPWDDNLKGAVGLGIVNGTGYFVIWGNPNVFYKVNLAKAKDWYEE